MGDLGEALRISIEMFAPRIKKEKPQKQGGKEVGKRRGLESWTRPEISVILYL